MAPVPVPVELFAVWEGSLYGTYGLVAARGSIQLYVQGLSLGLSYLSVPALSICERDGQTMAIRMGDDPQID